MIRNVKFLLTTINFLLLFTVATFGQEFSKDFQRSNNKSSLTNIFSGYSIGDLYDYSNYNISANTNPSFRSRSNSFELKPNVKKTLTGLKVELESVPHFKNENIKLKTSTDDNASAKESKSFFQSEIFYFACAAVLATTAYLVWKKNDDPVNTSKTFGTPPLPQNN